MPISLPKAPSLLVSLLALGITTLAASERWAPNAAAGPVNQLDVSGNACGPAALLTAYRCGDPAWQKIDTGIPGKSDKSKLLYIIRAHGLRPSASLKDRKRWTGDGINTADLLDVAGELSTTFSLPPLKSDDLFRKGREKPESLLRRCHDRMRDSLKKGFPPILSIRRYVLQNGQWHSVRGHFITIVAVPDKLPRSSRGFSFTCFDPWGGKKRTGRFLIPTRPVLSIDGKSSTCLQVDAPGLNIGKSLVRSGQTTALVPAVIAGRW